jgi:tryptophanase
MSEKPKKPQRNTNKAKKINLNVTKRWQDIVQDVDKKQVPINILQQITVRLIDGTNISIDVKKLLSEGMDEDEIETMLDLKFNELDAYIENVDFFVDIEKVKAAIQPETDKVLKGL